MPHPKVAALLALALLSGHAAAQSVTTYHNDISRHGAYVVPGLTAAAAATTTLDPAFHGSFTGAVYAQPLYWQPKPGATGSVIVATEANQVEALDANTGAVVWQTQLPPPPSVNALQCGNIPLEGITGTPAIDPATGILYLDAVTGTAPSTVRHKLYALDAGTGAIEPGYPLDVREALATRGIAFDPTDQGERGAALFFNGDVYFAYGGRAGDCGKYHGTVVQLTPGARPSLTGAWATRAVRGGIWAQSGSASDGTSIYVTTGNTSGATNYGDGEGIIRLHPGLARSASPLNFFTPSNWRTLDADDLDLGGTEALPFTAPGGAARLIAFGKDGNAYLVGGANLGGIGGQLAVKHVSNSPIITAPAIYNTAAAAMVVFRNAADLSCGSSALTMLSITASAASPISQLWCAPLNGAGAPIVTTTDGTANPLVWVVGAEGDNLLHGFDAMTGQAVFGGGGQTLSGLRHFETLLAANGHLYVAGNGQLYAFKFTGD